MSLALLKTAREPGARFVAPGLILAVFAISFAALFFRKAAPTHPLVMAGIRLAIASLILSPFAFRALTNGRLDARRIVGALIGGGLYAVHFGAWVSSLLLTSVAASVTLVTTTPLILALIGFLSGTDRPDRRLWGSLLLALLGMGILGGRDLALSPDALLGDALAFLGALAMAGYLLLVRRMGEDLDLLGFAAITTGVGAVLLLACAWLLGIPIEAASEEAFLYLVAAALLPQLIGHNLLSWALRYAQPTAVAMAVVGEPVVASLFGWLWLGEALGLWAAIGCGLTLLAVVLAVLTRAHGLREKKIIDGNVLPSD